MSKNTLSDYERHWALTELKFKIVTDHVKTNRCYKDEKHIVACMEALRSIYLDLDFALLTTEDPGSNLVKKLPTNSTTKIFLKKNDTINRSFSIHFDTLERERKERWSSWERLLSKPQIDMGAATP